MFFYKRPYESYLRMALRDHPELLVGLNFRDLKRYVADELVGRLAEREDQYQHTTLQLMTEIASMERFPDLEKLDDAEVRIPEARKAVAELRRWTDRYASAVTERERMEAERAAAMKQAEVTRKFADEIESLRQRFMEMFAMTDPHERGYAFQDFLDKLFVLFDMEPRVAYSLKYEQIDGSLSFDTDDCIVEAKWRKGLAEPADAHNFAAKTSFRSLQ